MVRLRLSGIEKFIIFKFDRLVIFLVVCLYKLVFLLYMFSNEEGRKFCVGSFEKLLKGMEGMAWCLYFLFFYRVVLSFLGKEVRVKI